MSHLTTPQGAEGVCVAFIGEIDMSTADTVRAAIADALLPPAPRLLCVDLTGVRFLDSSGINALVRGRAHAAASNCRLTVSNPQPIVHQTLEITGLLDVLGVTPAGMDGAGADHRPRSANSPVSTR